MNCNHQHDNFNSLKKHSLEITVFICGMVVMIFEIVGSRVLAPHLGTSIYVWTSLIGVILASLSVGYWQGGKLADENPSLKTLSLIVFLAGFFILATALFKDQLILLVHRTISDLKWAAVLSAFILFTPASILLGMVLPYATKLRLTDLTNSGKTIGNLYALSTIGSILGTFLCGFVLIPLLGSYKILISLGVVLAITALLFSPKLKNWFTSKTQLFLLVLFALSVGFSAFSPEYPNLIDVETPYNRVLIYNTMDTKSKKEIKVMRLNNYINAAMFLNSDELVYEYSKYYRAFAKHFVPNFKNVLCLGGAAYSIPKNFLKHHPETKMDVVEIDAGITELAKKYFNLTYSPNLKIHHEDARTFINQTTEKYDVICWDVFTSVNNVPFQLTTKEVTEKLFSMLNENGIVLLNTIGSIEGKKGKFLRAEHATYKSVFKNVYLFAVQDEENGELIQNIILVALKSNDTPNFQSEMPEINEKLQHIWKKGIPADQPVLTDDYAPANYLLNQ